MSSTDESRFRLVLQYDGSGFLGWQVQPQGRTVQGEMEAALRRLTGARRPIVAAGRTDTGVHATGQETAVTVPSTWTATELMRALNAVLPDDIWIKETQRVPSEFHPRYHAVSRSYEYRLGLSPQAFSPFFKPWCWPLEKRVDTDLLARSAALLKGTHSFRAFAKTGQEERGYDCVVTEASWQDWTGVGVAFSISADRFLHHMVRYLVGTMVEIGWQRRPLEEFERLLEGDDPRLVTSRPAPPRGLFLTAVGYAPGALEGRIRPAGGEPE